VVVVVGSKILVVETTATTITTGVAAVVAVIDPAVADKVMAKVDVTTAVVVVLKNATSFISSYIP
jgi:hypothetical protein